MGHVEKLGNMPGEFVSKIVFTFTLPCAVLHAFGAADFSPQMLLLVPLGFVSRLRRVPGHLRHHHADQSRGPRVLPAQRLRVQPGVLRAAVRAGHLLTHHGRGHLPLRCRQRVHDGRRLLCAHRPDRRRLAHPASGAFRCQAAVLQPALRHVPADHRAIGGGGSPALRAGSLHRAHCQRQLVSSNVHAGAHDELLRLARAHRRRWHVW